MATETSNEMLIAMLTNDVQVMRNPGDEHDYSSKEETPLKKQKVSDEASTSGATVEEAMLLLHFADQDSGELVIDESIVKEEYLETEIIQENDEDYANASRVESFKEEECSEAIDMQEDEEAAPEADSTMDDEWEDMEGSEAETAPGSGHPLSVPAIHPNFQKWESKSVYENLPAEAIEVLDLMLTHGHKEMVAVIKAFNRENPIDIHYNPKKSNTRISKPTGKRVGNNEDSRRSRLRKKFDSLISKLLAHYVRMENSMLEKKKGFYAQFIMQNEKALLNSGKVTVAQLEAYREQCGLVWEATWISWQGFVQQPSFCGFFQRKTAVLWQQNERNYKY